MAPQRSTASGHTRSRTPSTPTSTACSGQPRPTTLSGSGSGTITSNYQDVGNGLTLTSTSYQDSATGNDSVELLGEVNLQPFKIITSEPESYTDPIEVVGGGGAPVTSPDGLINAFPFSEMASGNSLTFAGGNVGGSMGGAGGGAFLQAGAVKGGIQSLYNHYVQRIGNLASKKVAIDIGAKKQIMDNIRLTKKATGTLTLEGPNMGGVAGPRGNIFAVAVGDADKLGEFQKRQLKGLPSAWLNPQLGRTDVQVTYVVDGAANAKRSGNVVVVYKYLQTYTGTKNGQAVSQQYPLAIGGVLQFHDDELETMENLKVQ